MQSLPIYASLLCNQVGLKFTMGGRIAWSAGGQINLPALPYEDKKTERLAYGMIMHEGGHEGHTDYQAWDTIKKDPAMANMVNRLEDIRIEKKQCIRFPGAKTRLQEMVEGLCENGYWRAPQDGDSPSTLLGMAILYQLRASVLSQSALREWGDDAFSRLEKAIPQSLAGHLMTIAEQVIWCKNTDEVVALAASILDLLKEEKEKLEEEQANPPQQQPQGQQQGQQGQAATPQGQGQSDPLSTQQGQEEQQGQNQGQGQGEPQSPQQGQGASQGQGEPGTTGEQPGQGGSQSAEQTANISSILKGEQDAAPGDVGKTICEALTEIGQENGDENIAMPIAKKSMLETGETAEILARVTSASRALQTRAYRLFEAMARKKRSYREEGRRVDPARLWRPKTGDYKVFVEKTETARINTAVQILVDCSTSMNSEGRIGSAINSALALAMALHKLNGVKVATASFPAVGSCSAAEGEQVGIIHTFDQRPESVAKKFAGIFSKAFTPTAEALLWSGRELSGRKEDRKIVFVITDGHPELPGKGRDAYRRLTIKVRQSMEEAGIEVVGLGIGIDVSAIFPKSVVVHDLDSLAGSVFALMNKTLLKAA